MLALRMGMTPRRRMIGGGAAAAPFVPEQLFSSDTGFESTTGWFTAPGSTISGGIASMTGTATSVVRRLNAGGYTRLPVSGEYVYVEFDLLTYSEGNINPRIRYTDGTYGYFFGDRLGNGPLAGGDADPGHWRSLTLQIPVGKTVDYVEFRNAVRNGSINATFDNFELWTSEAALDTTSWQAP